VTEHGRRFATVGGELQEVVVATANDVNALGYDGVCGHLARGVSTYR
jgi:hypothetical protein